MVGPAEKDRDSLELMEDNWKINFSNTILDLFSAEKTGLHEFFPRTENNDDFISKLIQWDHQLDPRKIFPECRDDEDVLDRQKVIDVLLHIFHSIGDAVKKENEIVFKESNLSKTQFLGKIQRCMINLVKIFEDSSFDGEDYFLAGVSPEYLVSYGDGTHSKMPPDLLDIQPKSSPQKHEVPLTGPSRLPGGKVITISFEREAAIREMLRDVGLNVTLETFAEDEFVKIALPEIRRVAESAIRRTSKATIRRIPNQSLDKIIDRASDEITRHLQDIAVQNQDRLVAQIILYFYKPGKEKLQALLDRSVREEVDQHFRRVHASPKTMVPPKRTETLRPSYRPYPAAVLPLPLEGTEGPDDSAPDVGDVVDDTRASLASAPVPIIEGAKIDDGADINDETTAINVPAFPTRAEIMDEETTISAPTAQLLAQTIEDEPLVKTPASPEIAPVQKLYDETEEGTTDKTDHYIVAGNLRALVPKSEGAAPVVNVPPAPKAIIEDEFPPFEQALPPPSSREFKPQSASKLLMGAVPVPTPQAAAAPAPDAQSPEPSKDTAWREEPTVVKRRSSSAERKDFPQPPPAVPKQSAFWGKARKWVGGAVFAAAAAMGVYAATQTGAPNNDEHANVQPGTTAKDKNAAPSATVTSTEVASSSTAAPSDTMNQSPNPNITQPKLSPETPKVATVLGSHSFDLGSADGAPAFTGTASLVEGGVDATPHAMGPKLASWYQNQQKSAEVLMKIYDSNKSRLDKDTVNYIDTHEKMLRELASQTDFTAAKFRSGFESHYKYAEIFGAKGIYNLDLAVERIISLYGGDAEKLLKDNASIKLTIGEKVLAAEQRFAKAFVMTASNGGNPGNGVPGNNGVQPQSDPQPQNGKSGFNNFNPSIQVHDVTPVNVPSTDLKFGFNNDPNYYDAQAIDDGWDIPVVPVAAAKTPDVIDVTEFARLITDQDVDMEAIDAGWELPAKAPAAADNVVDVTEFARLITDDDIDMEAIDAGWELPAKAVAKTNNSPEIETAYTDLNLAEIEMMEVDQEWDNIGRQHAAQSRTRKV